MSFEPLDYLRHILPETESLVGQSEGLTFERSCKRYMVLRDTTAEPDPVRLRHREALIAIVAEIVRGQQRPGEAAVRRVAASLVPAEDLDAVLTLAMDDLRNLHEGNVTRYRLRLSEYRAWQPMQQPKEA